MKYGLQMYSVRDAAEKDLLGTLEKVAALGYHYAEFAGFFGYSAEAVRDKLLECGMEVSSTHTGMQELADDVIVMHDGEIVEKGRVLELFDSPQEEYTKRLLKASFEGAENCS